LNVKFEPRLLIPEDGHLGSFKEYDRVYKSGLDSNSKSNPIRVCFPLNSDPNHFPQYNLIYSGVIDRRTEAPCMKRPVIHAVCSTDPAPMLEWLGCEFRYEYVRNGYRFQTSSGYKVELYEVLKLIEHRNPKLTRKLIFSESIQDMESDISSGPYWILEISADVSITSSKSIAGDLQVSPSIHSVLQLFTVVFVIE